MQHGMRNQVPADNATISPWINAWANMLDEGDRIQSEFYGTRYARTLTTEKLKALWDLYDGCDRSIGDDLISGEAIHTVLNERGEGEYCAV